MSDRQWRPLSFLRVSVAAKAAICWVVVTSNATGQHADIYVGQSSAGTIVTGTGGALPTVGQRVFTSTLQRSLVTVNPGFLALDAGNAGIPPGTIALPGDSRLGFNAVAFRPPDGDRSNFFVWDGADDEVEFIPVPDGYTLEIKSLSEQSIRVDGRAEDVPGFDFVITEPGGGVHDHMAFTLRDGDSIAGTSPIDGTYLFGMELTMEGLEASEPILVAISTIGVGPPQAKAASDWLNENIDLFEFGTPLQAGDANQDLQFDQLDLVQVQIAAKYLTGQPATWGEGDWNAAPGGSPDAPPTGDGLFNQLDIVAAQQAGMYLTGPYAAVGPNGDSADGQFDIDFGETASDTVVDASGGALEISTRLDTGAPSYTSDAADLGSSLGMETGSEFNNTTLDILFDSISFGTVGQSALADRSAPGHVGFANSLSEDGGRGEYDLIYVPEPASAFLLLVGAIVAVVCSRGHGARTRKFHTCVQ